VLTLERVDGVTVREMLTAITNRDDQALESWAARGITPERTAVILLRSVLEQTMRIRSFNADPHPSNLIVSDGGTLNWVDFGLVGWIDERQWDQQMRLRTPSPTSRSTAPTWPYWTGWSRCPTNLSASSGRSSGSSATS
jgi:predicted unusual protein kinase regulating ubiquinone biosynthesis (AarF/ABC1/UbiB family)